MRPTSAHDLPSSISVPQPSIQHSAGTPHSRQHLPHEGQKTKQTEGNPKNQPRCRNRRKLTTTNTILSERRRCTVWRGKAGAAQRSQGWEVPQPSRPCPCTCLLHTLGGGGTGRGRGRGHGRSLLAGPELCPRALPDCALGPAPASWACGHAGPGWHRREGRHSPGALPASQLPDQHQGQGLGSRKVMTPAGRGRRRASDEHSPAVPAAHALARPDTH